MGKLLNYNYFNNINYRYVTDIYEYYNPYSGPRASDTQELNRLITKGEFHPLYTGRLTTRNLWDEHLYGDDCLVDSWASRYRVSIHIKCTGSKSFETDWTGNSYQYGNGVTYTRNDVFHYSQTVTLNITISNLRVWDETETNVFDDTTKLSAAELIDRGFDLSWSSGLANNNYPITSSSTFSCNLHITSNPTPAGYYPRTQEYSSGYSARWGHYDGQWLFIYQQNVHRNGST